jgi:hypothetical protein
MDTDELSTQTFNAILATAENFNHNLTLQFGLLAYECNSDDDFLQKAHQLIEEWKQDPDSSMEEIFFDVAMPPKAAFKKVLTQIQQNIVKVQQIPVKKRTFEL